MIRLHKDKIKTHNLVNEYNAVMVKYSIYIIICITPEPILFFPIFNMLRLSNKYLLKPPLYSLFCSRYQGMVKDSTQKITVLMKLTFYLRETK